MVGCGLSVFVRATKSIFAATAVTYLFILLAVHYVCACSLLCCTFTMMIMYCEYTHGVSKKNAAFPTFYILNNSAKSEPILIIFGVQVPEEVSHQKVVNSPV